MNAIKLETLIRSLGRTHEELLAESVIPDDELIELFPDIDELYLEPEPGISMNFWTDTGRFELFSITLIASLPECTEYKGELPAPYAPTMNQSTIHSLFGEPLEFSGPFTLPGETQQYGGWESFLLDPTVHPNTKVYFGYLESMEIYSIGFALVDRGHE